VLTTAALDSPEAVAALTGALNDPDLEVRIVAAADLARLRDPASIPALAAIVADWDHPALTRCRHAALRTLLAFRSQEAAVGLARALALGRPDRPLGLNEHSALLAVAYAEPAGTAAPLVVRALVRLLGAGEKRAAERAASLLALFPAESHGPLARVLRTSADPTVRRRAAVALGACRHHTAVAALVRALNDPVAGVRAAAADSLGDIRDPAVGVALETAVSDGDKGVREAARSALGRLGAR
jgi:HEAT repeat protein